MSDQRSATREKSDAKECRQRLSAPKTAQEGPRSRFSDTGALRFTGGSHWLSAHIQSIG
jgi:hypothetical protein